MVYCSCYTSISPICADVCAMLQLIQEWCGTGVNPAWRGVIPLLIDSGGTTLLHSRKLFFCVWCSSVRSVYGTAERRKNTLFLVMRCYNASRVDAIVGVVHHNEFGHTVYIRAKSRFFWTIWNLHEIRTSLPWLLKWINIVTGVKYISDMIRKNLTIYVDLFEHGEMVKVTTKIL